MKWVIGILIDLIIVGIIILSTRKGSKDGFAKTLVGFLAFAIAVVMAGALCAPVANLVYDKAVKTTVENTVYNAVSENIGTSLSATADEISNTVDTTIEKLPAFIRGITEIEEKRDDVINSINQLKKADAKEITDNIVLNYIAPIAIKVLSALVFIVLFVVLFFACKLLSKCLKLVNKLPLIGKLNEFLGGVLGVLQGAVIAIALCWVLVAVTSDGGSLFKIITAETIESSIILKAFATYNPLNFILSKLSF